MAGRITQRFINDLLDRVDIVALIDERVKLKRAGASYKARCPFHEEKTPSFNVSQERQSYHCFGCGVSGTAITFLMEHDRLDFVTAIEMLAARAGVQIEYEGGQAPRENRQRDRLLGVLERTAELYRTHLRAPEGSAARQYLRQRGVSQDVAERFDLGAAPPGWDNVLAAFANDDHSLLVEAGLAIAREGRDGHYDRFRDRLMFPIRNFRGRVIGFGGRVLGEGEPKYLNSPETPVFHKGEEVYGLYEAKRANRSLTRLVLVEGYMDVVALAQAGITEVVATLGTATTAQQLQRLFKLVPEVVLCYDGDQAGQAAAWKALNTALPLLSDEFKLAFIFLPDGEDPDTLVRAQGESAFRERIESAQSMAEYLFSYLAGGLDLNDIDDRAQFAKKAQPLIAQVPAGVRRRLLEQRLSELVGLPSSAAPAPGAAAGRADLPNEPWPEEDLSPARHRPPGFSPTRVSSSRFPKGQAGPLGRRPEADQALVLLLQQPALAAAVGGEQADALANSSDRPARRLGRVIEFLQSSPGADLGSVLGYLHGDEEFETVLRLARVDVEIDAIVAAAEFRAAVASVNAAAERNQRRSQVSQVETDEDLARFIAQLAEKRRE